MAAVAHEARVRGRRRPLSRKLGAAGPFTYLFLIVVALLSLFPLYWSLVVASHDNSAIAAYPPVLTPGNQLWHNVSRLFNSGEVNVNFWTALINSTIVAAIVTVSVVFFSALAGFAFAKLRFRGRNGLLVFVIATMAVPTQLGIVPLFIVMSKLGWIGSLWAVIIPSAVSAFGVFWMTQYLQEALPDELIEAARVDGASTLRTFWSVALPAARPGAAMLGLFTFIVNAFMLQITEWVCDWLNLDFTIDEFFWDAVLAAVVITFVSWVLNIVLPDDD